jgi:hypothetical protein
MRCNAGKGCQIDCPGKCVARWDELNFCETRCLESAAKVQPLPLSAPFSLELHAGDGRQVRALFKQYLPDDVARALDETDDPIDLKLDHASLDDLIEGLSNLLAGTKA